MQKLNMVDADALLYQPLDKPRFVVDGLLPTGLILFCGSQKIGKSWLMLKLCLCVSAGLIVQLEDYLKEYPDSRLIVIDTLQMVRTASKDNAYASDYGDISQIKEFADKTFPCSGSCPPYPQAERQRCVQQGIGNNRADGERRCDLCFGKGNEGFRYSKALLCGQGHLVSGVCPALLCVQLGAGGAKRAGTACKGKHTACSFSAGGVYAG